ncbi:YciI family protein [Nocardia testacea]|uniref:YciI family protein n=1 Tax=Nocardia testacea TaxID=248551 RepID=A0ABW7VWK3_9NOCA
MRYTLLLHYPEESAETVGAEAIEQGMAAFASYAATLHAAGVLVAAEVLQPSASSTTVRMRDGVLLVQDGPFADTKDQLGGTIVIDVPDLDAAISWAREAPAVRWGAVEIRPGATHTVAGVWTPGG